MTKNETDLTANILLRKREYEELFVSAAFMRPDQALRECGWVTPDHFHDQEARKFWIAFQETGGDNTAAALAVNEKYLARLASIGAQDIFYGYGVRQYAEAVITEGWFYAVGSNLPKLALALGDGELEIAQAIVGKISNEIIAVSEKIPHSGDIGERFIESLELENRTIFTGTPIDDPVGGLWRRILSVLCARPGVGKTALSWQLARCVARGYKVFFVSQEMGAEELWGRAACGVLRLNYKDVIAGKISDDDKQELINITYKLIGDYGTNLLVDDTPMTTADIWRKSATAEPDLVVVDHIRLLGDKHREERHRLGQITWNLKKLSREFDCHVMALAQLNRGLEARQDKKPTLADLRDSGEIEENADIVFGMHRDMKDTGNISHTDLDVLKFRGGPCPLLIKLNFNLKRQWFDRRVL